MFDSVNLPSFSMPGFGTESGSGMRARAAEAIPRESAAAPAYIQQQRISERFSNDESFSISMMTQEGDKVEISFSSQERYAAEYGSKQTPGRSSEFYDISRDYSSQFGFSVQGDLNTDELDAITGLVQEISRIADDFFNGDIQSAFNQATELEMDTSQLASLNMSMQQSMEYSAVEKYRQVQAMGQPEGGRQLQPYLNDLSNQVARADSFVAQASSFSMTLLSELIVRDNRVEELPQSNQLNSNLEQLRSMVDSMLSQAAEQADVERDAEQDD